MAAWGSVPPGSSVRVTPLSQCHSATILVICPTPWCCDLRDVKVAHLVTYHMWMLMIFSNSSKNILKILMPTSHWVNVSWVFIFEFQMASLQNAAGAGVPFVAFPPPLQAFHGQYLFLCEYISYHWPFFGVKLRWTIISAMTERPRDAGGNVSSRRFYGHRSLWD